MQFRTVGRLFNMVQEGESWVDNWSEQSVRKLVALNHNYSEFT